MMNNLAFCGIVLLLWINIPAETDAMPNDKGRELGTYEELLFKIN